MQGHKEEAVGQSETVSKHRQYSGSRPWNVLHCVSLMAALYIKLFPELNKK